MRPAAILLGALLAAAAATSAATAAETAAAATAAETAVAQAPAIVRARASLEQAAEALEAARGGTASLAALGAAVTAHESALAAYRESLRGVAAREALLRAEIGRARARLAELVTGLQSMRQAPRAALLGLPGGPLAALRGAALMAGVAPHLGARAGELQASLEQLARLRLAQEAARNEARGELAALQALRAETAEALRARPRLGMPSEDDFRAMAEAAGRQARSLDGLAAALDGGMAAAPRRAVAFADARGTVPSPVRGVVTAGFGASDPWGRPGRGLTLRAPAFAQIVAPWDATVRYAGPLVGYGRVVVLEPEAGTLIVLAGLGRVDRLVGETVLAGEPVGELGGPMPESVDFLLTTATDRDAVPAQNLYIELRRAGEPVDPALWFDLAMQGTDE